MKAHIIALLLAACCFGCSSNQRAIVTPYAGHVGRESQRHAGKFREAMTHADFAGAEHAASNDEERTCARAFRLFAEGDECAAEALLNDLESARDSLVKNYAETLRGQMLFAQNRWSELKALPQTDPSDASAVLASAYASCPKEELVFDAGYGKLPITLSSTGTPVVEVEVNGVKKKFWFDTGAGLTVIASDAAQECGVRMIGSYTTVSGTSTSKQVAIMPAMVAELKLGALHLKHHPVMIIDKKDLEFKLLGLITLMKIDGIIGWNLIKQLGWKIDYRNKTIEAFRSEPGARTESETNFFWLGYPTVAITDSAGRAFLLGMDTGAKQTTLSKAFISESNVAPGETESRTFGGAGGFEKTEVQKLANVSLILRDHTIFFPEIYTHEHELMPVITLHGTFGGDIAREGMLVIDYPHRKIMLHD